MKKNAPSTERAAAIYREAALSLEVQGDIGMKYSSPYSCDHIGAVLGLYRAGATDKVRGTFRDLRERYATLFAPEPEGDDMWWHGWEDAPNERVLALCFMAAMVEAGDA